ncbi:MAG: hypothetical protein U5L11_01020 [Arhodomonas sp.]|nr:hypothetical protein [Arhodomonas sp.]
MEDRTQGATGQPPEAQVGAFIQRWAGATGTEQSNAQMFLYELCQALELPIPDTEGDEAHGNAYVIPADDHRARPGRDAAPPPGRSSTDARIASSLEAKKLKAGESTALWHKAKNCRHHKRDLPRFNFPAPTGSCRSAVHPNT